MNRRNFLIGGVAFGFSALTLPRAEGRLLLPVTRSKTDPKLTGYGDLRPLPSQNTGETLLALPAGFQYTVFGQTGTRMSDGRATPTAHDGMACFSAPDGMLRLIRNHELRSPGTPIDPSRAYDINASGGTTTLVIDPATRLPVSQFATLSGTASNCGGGPTPWGSWLTCEENVASTSAGFSNPHGYVFEVPSSANAPVDPVPIRGMGRFYHEAAAVDPYSGYVYLTEDTATAGFYRFVPNRYGDLRSGGRLQMLMVDGAFNYDTRTGQRDRRPLPVRWVNIADPDPPGVENNPGAVYQQGIAAGGATFSHLEGCCYQPRRMVFVATLGGDARLGQVWEYRSRNFFRGRLSLLYEATDPNALDKPDNVCSSNRGGILLCEDGGGSQYLRGLAADGTVFDFAKNIVPFNPFGEFAGATFSPDGQTLFVNIQFPGLTFAIWGPWQNGEL